MDGKETRAFEASRGRVLGALAAALAGCSVDGAQAPDTGPAAAASETVDGGTTDAAGEGSTTPMPSVVYVTLVSHNERNLQRFGRFRESLEGYGAFRGNLLRIAGLVAKYQARLSYQTDYVVLDGVERYEAGVLAADATPTGGKPLFTHLTEDLGVSLEAHAHECLPDTGNPSFCADKAYNYADLAARIQQVTGVTPPGIVGGTTSAERTLDAWKRCITPNVFAEKWCPQAITVFAGETGGHTGGDDFHSGVWRPSSLTTGFLTDDPGGTVAYVGSGYLFVSAFGGGKVDTEPVAGIRTLVQMIADGEIAAGKIVTASIMLVEDTILDDDLYDEVEAILVQVKAMADAGSVVFATYPEVLEAWQTVHGSVPNLVTF